MESGELGYYVYRLAGAIAPRIPSPIGYRAAELLGGLICALSPSRSVVQENLSHIVGEPATSPRIRALARQVFRNQCKNYFDLLRVASLDDEAIKNAVRGITGIEHLDRALDRGRGVVLASAHYGNFDLAGQLLAIRGYKVIGIAEHLKPERLFRFLMQTRTSHGLRFIPVDSLLRPVFRALRANEIVGLALDRNVTDAGREVLFAGWPARMPDGYLRLALHTQAALIVAFCHRLPDNTFLIQVEPEVALERTGDMDHDIAVNLPRVLGILETCLRRHPEQWVYFQRVWLPTPPATGDAQAVRTYGASGGAGPENPSEETAR